MKSLRYIAFTIVATIGVFSSILYTSCNKDKCGSTTCNNGGTCTENVCVCPTGYSGSSCSTGWDDGTIGTYNCSRANCTPSVAGTNSWISAVTKDATDGGFTIDISNFDNSNTTILAIVDSNNNISISPAAGTYGVDASGTYNSATGVINLHFTTSIGGYTCNMTMKKE